MYRAAIATITAAYAVTIPLLAGVSDASVDQFAAMIGLEPDARIMVHISDDAAVDLALAATIANHRPPFLTVFEDHQDAEPQPVIEVLASLN